MPEQPRVLEVWTSLNSAPANVFAVVTNVHSDLPISERINEFMSTLRILVNNATDYGSKAATHYAVKGRNRPKATGRHLGGGPSTFKRGEGLDSLVRLKHIDLAKSLRKNNASGPPN